MAEFKSMTVRALRDLARKAIGRGHSKLKTKAELIEALRAAEKRVARAAEKAAEKMKEAAGKTPRATGTVVETLRGKVRETGAAKAGVRGVRAAHGEPEPDPEGHMVARVAGEDAVRDAPHPMTESAMEARRRPPARDAAGEPRARPNGYDEQLGELPWSYSDDVLAALPRDPRTLFLYWDHAQETLRQAFQDLDGGRPQLWIFARETGGWQKVRTVDFALESRSYYVHDLEPGCVYRAEIHVIDRRGRERLLARPSNEMMLPPVGPSPTIGDRFMRILWGEPLQRLLREPQPGSPFPDDVRAQLARLSDWSRFAGRVWGGSAGGMGGRPFSPTSSPSVPTSPSSPWGRTDGESP